jgi:hypothetical protein
VNLYLQVKLCFRSIQLRLTVKSDCLKGSMGTIRIIRPEHSLILLNPAAEVNSKGRIKLELNESDAVMNSTDDCNGLKRPTLSLIAGENHIILLADFHTITGRFIVIPRDQFDSELRFSHSR